MKIFTLHTGTWDGCHLTGVFSNWEKAEAYIKKFNITDNPTIEEVELDPLDSIVNSNQTAYLATCTKKAKVKLRTKDVNEFFVNNNVHFNHGTMYYYLTADGDKQAIQMAEKMRERFIAKDWQEQLNAGEQLL